MPQGEAGLKPFKRLDVVRDKNRVTVCGIPITSRRDLMQKPTRVFDMRCGASLSTRFIAFDISRLVSQALIKGKFCAKSPLSRPDAS